MAESLTDLTLPLSLDSPPTDGMTTDSNQASAEGESKLPSPSGEGSTANQPTTPASSITTTAVAASSATSGARRRRRGEYTAEDIASRTQGLEKLPTLFSDVETKWTAYSTQSKWAAVAVKQPFKEKLDNACRAFSVEQKRFREVNDILSRQPELISAELEGSHRKWLKADADYTALQKTMVEDGYVRGVDEYEWDDY